MPVNPEHVHSAQTKLGKLLGEVLVHASPWTSEVSEQTRARFREELAEEFESHAAGLTSKLLESLAAAGELPPELVPLVAELKDPSQQVTSLISAFFVYGVMFNLASTTLQPFMQIVSNEIWKANAVKPVDPAIIATAVGRGLELGDPPTVHVPDWAYTAAGESGIPKPNVDLMASIIGLPPAMQELFEMVRREIISEGEAEQGLREGDFRDDWIKRAMQLTHGWLTPSDFVRAAVQEQLPYDEARAWAYKTGLDTTTPVPVDVGGTALTPDMFGAAVAISGRPPGPQEMGRMANRGIIPWSGTGAGVVTFQQGIAESDVKTKWTDALRQLEAYVPPPREVGTLLEHGAISEAVAKKYWEDGGVPAPLAEGYLYMTQQEHIGQDKLAAAGEIKTAYFDHIMTHAEALEGLSLLGIRGQVAEDMLAIIDFRREIQAINSIVRKVGTLYENFKITAVDAKAALLRVGVEPGLAESLLTTWNTVRIAPVRVPSVEEIAKAVKYETITTAEGLEDLERLGFQPRDAAIVLSAYGEVKVEPLPPAGTTVTG